MWGYGDVAMWGYGDVVNASPSPKKPVAKSLQPTARSRQSQIRPCRACFYSVSRVKNTFLLPISAKGGSKGGK